MTATEVEYCWYTVNCPESVPNENFGRAPATVAAPGNVTFELETETGDLEASVCLLLYAAGNRGIFLTELEVQKRYEWATLGGFRGFSVPRVGIAQTLREYIYLEDILRFAGLICALTTEAGDPGAPTEAEIFFGWRAALAGAVAPKRLRQKAALFRYDPDRRRKENSLTPFGRAVLWGACVDPGSHLVHLGKSASWHRHDEFVGWTAEWARQRPQLRDSVGALERAPPARLRNARGALLIFLDFPSAIPPEKGVLLMARERRSHRWCCTILRSETDHFRITNFMLSGAKHYELIAGIL